VQQRLPSLRDVPIAFAHRGAKAHAPENTLEAFQLALKLGANGVETDAWLTSDGVAVLDHDGVHRSGLRKKNISQVKRIDLEPHVPDFVQCLALCSEGVHVSVDVKDVSAAKTLVADAVSVGFPLQNLWLCHFDLSQVLAMRKIHSDVRIVDSTRLNKMKDGPEMRSALLAENGIDALNMHISDWSGGLVTLVHRFNVLAFGWDAQFAPVLTSAFRMGLDGVYSDYVDRMVDVYTSEIGCVPPT